MSKSVDSPLGTVGDARRARADIERKVRRAVTDTDGEVRYDPEAKPGLSNLLELLAAATGDAPSEVAGRYDQYGDLKRDAGRRARRAAPSRPASAAPSCRADPAPCDRVLTSRGRAGPRGRRRHLRQGGRGDRAARPPLSRPSPPDRQRGRAGWPTTLLILIEQPGDGPGMQVEVEQHEPEQDGHACTGGCGGTRATTSAGAAARAAPTRRGAGSGSG